MCSKHSVMDLWNVFEPFLCVQGCLNTVLTCVVGVRIQEIGLGSRSMAECYYLCCRTSVYSVWWSILERSIVV